VHEFNRDSIPFYLSVPAEDLDVFAEPLKGVGVTLIADVEVVRKNPRIDVDLFAKLPGAKPADRQGRVLAVWRSRKLSLSR